MATIYQLRKGNKEDRPLLALGELTVDLNSGKNGDKPRLVVGGLNGDSELPIAEDLEIPKFSDRFMTDGAVNQLMQTAMSYYRNNPLLTYGNFHTLFNDDSGATPEGYEIDCSSFLQACFMGISFENSKYLNYKNYQNNARMIFPDSALDPEEGRMLANDLAEYAYNNGWLYECLPDYSNVQEGDIVFLSNRTDDIYFENIGHCQLAMRRNQTGSDSITFIQGNDQTTAIDIETMTPAILIGKKAFFGCRFPMRDSAQDARVINYDATEQIDHVGGGTTNFADINTIEPLETNQLYTLFFKVEFSNPSTYPILRFDAGTTIYSFGSSLSKRPDGMFKVTFILEDIPVGYENLMQLYLNPDSDATTTLIALYKGYVSEFTGYADNIPTPTP